MTQLVFTLVGT